MLININIRVTFTIPETGEVLIIDSAYSRNSGGIVPYMAVSGVSIAGSTPIINLTLANLPPAILSKISILNLKSNIRIDAGYNDKYHFIGEGNMVSFPEIQATDTDWLWTADITPLPDFLNELDYTQDFEKFRTWEYVLNRYFGKSNVSILIPPDLASQAIGVEFSYNINTFIDLQDHFKARNKFLDYRDGIITFTDGRSATGTIAEITPRQIKPNQYLDFQSGASVPLQLAAWIPTIRSGIYVNLKDEESVTFLGTTQGFTGTMGVLKSSIHLTTTENPTHQLLLRQLVEE